MMGKAVTVGPDAAVEAGRGNGAVADGEPGRCPADEWIIDLDPARDSVGAADAKVTAAIHSERAVPAQGDRTDVGSHALRDPAAVESHPRRAGNGAVGVDRDPRPRRRVATCGWTPLGRVLERSAEGSRLLPPERLAVSGSLQSVDAGGVDEAPGQGRRPLGGLQKSRHVTRNRDRRLSRSIELHQLALRFEAGQHRVDPAKLALQRPRSQLGGCAIRAPRHADQDADARAKELERTRDLLSAGRGAHEVDVCTGAGAGAGWVTGALGTVTTVAPSSSSDGTVTTVGAGLEFEGARWVRAASFGPRRGSLPAAICTDRTAIRMVKATTLARIERFRATRSGSLRTGWAVLMRRACATVVNGA